MQEYQAHADQSSSPARRGRLLIFIVAYNAEKTIESVLQRIPEQLRDLYDVEVLIIDDSSQDETFRKSELVRRAKAISFKLTVLYNPVNQGYGGNQKIGFHYALEQNFDWVALVHGDGQYAPECLPELVEVLADGRADAVFGSRMMEKRQALKGGMPLYKYVGNKTLTTFQNWMLGSSLSEFHSGYRLYAIEALRQIPFQKNSNDFHFDTEIIIQLIFAGLRIRELPIPTFYGDEICHVNGMKYAWDVFKATLLARVQPFHIFYDPKFDCKPAGAQSEESLSESLYCDALLSERIPPGSRIVVVGRGGERLRQRLQDSSHTIETMTPESFREDFQEGRACDFLFMLDDSGMAQQPEEVLEQLAAVSRLSPDLKICVTIANVGFIINRLLLLFGRFGYTRRGIINLNAFHFFTLRTARRMFGQRGFTVTKVVGLPIPFSGLFSSDGLAGALTRLHRGLIALRKSLFSFQFVFFVSPPTSLPYLLATAVEFSSKKSAVIGEDDGCRGEKSFARTRAEKS
ncbi:MAG TPA: glycosyltransferase/methyltransferase [Desulfobulbaceae bacterium]|nr:glycosyltransferase/methyltransferase [Desulfobulbaceae bacterium]